MKMRKRDYERLAKCVIVALVFTGGGTAVMPGTAMAQTTEITTDSGTTETDYVVGNHSDTDLTAVDPAKGYTGHIINMRSGTVGSLQGAVSNDTSNVSGNTVNIYGADDILYGIYGGMSTGGGTSSNNTINIYGTINISGYLDGFETQTVNIASKGNHIGNIEHNSEAPLNMNFFLPSDTKVGDTMLTVDTSVPGFGTDLRNTTFGVAAQSGLSLNVGDKVTLISDTNGIKTDSTLKTTTILPSPQASPPTPLMASPLKRVVTLPLPLPSPPKAPAPIQSVLNP